MDYSLNQKLSLKNKMITFHFFFSLFFSMLKITEIRELQYTIFPICVEQKRNFIENWNRMENTPQTMNLQLNINETTYNVTQLSRRHWFKVLRVSFHENAPQLRLKTSSESLVSVYNFALTELTHTHTCVYFRRPDKWIYHDVEVLLYWSHPSNGRIWFRCANYDLNVWRWLMKDFLSCTLHIAAMMGNSNKTTSDGS